MSVSATLGGTPLALNAEMTLPDVETIVVCSQTDQLMAAATTGSSTSASLHAHHRHGGPPLPLPELSGLATIERHHSCAPVTSFDYERFRNFVQQQRAVFKHYYTPRPALSPRTGDGASSSAATSATANNATASAATLPQLLQSKKGPPPPPPPPQPPSSGRKGQKCIAVDRRCLAVLTDHMTPAQHEQLAGALRARILQLAAAHTLTLTSPRRGSTGSNGGPDAALPPPHVEIVFYHKNPNSNVRGKEYIRTSVPNTSDIAAATKIQRSYLNRCRNLYNYARAEEMLKEAQAQHLALGGAAAAGGASPSGPLEGTRTGRRKRGEESSSDSDSPPIGGGGVTADGPAAAVRGKKKAGGTVFSGTSTQRRQLLTATNVYAQELARASIALADEDLRKSPASRQGGQRPGVLGEADAPPVLVDPNRTLVVGQIKAFAKGRFDGKSGAYTGPPASASSLFASEHADHAATARRRSAFSARTAGARDADDPAIEGRAGHGEATATGGTPRHAKFLVTATPFAPATGSAAHSSAVVAQVALYNSLFEQANGVGALSQAPAQVQPGDAFLGGSALADIRAPLTHGCKQQLLHRLLDAFPALVPDVIHAGAVVGGATQGAAARVQGLTDLPLQDYLLALLSPTPLEVRRLTATLQPAPSDTAQQPARAAGVPPSTLNAAALRLSPRKAEDIVATVDGFVRRKPPPPPRNLTEYRLTDDPQRTTPRPAPPPDLGTGAALEGSATYRRRLRAAAATSAQPASGGSRELVATTTALTTGGAAAFTEGRPPALAFSYSSSYADHLVSSLIDRRRVVGVGAAPSPPQGQGGERRRGSVTTVVAPPPDSPRSKVPPQLALVNTAKNTFDAASVLQVRAFDQFFRVYDPELGGLARRDLFLLALMAAAAATPDLSHPLARTRPQSAHRGEASPRRPGGGAGGHRSAHHRGQRTHRLDARSAPYYCALWMVALLLAQPAPSEAVRLGELFALRDCLLQVVRREQRLVGENRELTKLRATIHLLTPRAKGLPPALPADTGLIGGALLSPTDGPLRPLSGGTSDGARSLTNTPRFGASAGPGSSAPGSAAGPGALTVAAHNAAFDDADLAPLRCLERAAQHAVETHRAVSYGELATALVDSLEHAL